MARAREEEALRMGILFGTTTYWQQDVITLKNYIARKTMEQSRILLKAGKDWAEKERLNYTIERITNVLSKVLQENMTETPKELRGVQEQANIQKKVDEVCDVLAEYLTLNGKGGVLSYETKDRRRSLFGSLVGIDSKKLKNYDITQNTSSMYGYERGQKQYTSQEVLDGDWSSDEQDIYNKGINSSDFNIPAAYDPVTYVTERAFADRRIGVVFPKRIKEQEQKEQAAQGTPEQAPEHSNSQSAVTQTQNSTPPRLPPRSNTRPPLLNLAGLGLSNLEKLNNNQSAGRSPNH